MGKAPEGVAREVLLRVEKAGGKSREGAIGVERRMAAEVRGRGIETSVWWRRLRLGAGGEGSETEETPAGEGGHVGRRPRRFSAGEETNEGGEETVRAGGGADAAGRPRVTGKERTPGETGTKAGGICIVRRRRLGADGGGAEGGSWGVADGEGCRLWRFVPGGGAEDGGGEGARGEGGNKGREGRGPASLGEGATPKALADVVGERRAGDVPEDGPGKEGRRL